MNEFHKTSEGGQAFDLITGLPEDIRALTLERYNKFIDHLLSQSRREGLSHNELSQELLNGYTPRNGYIAEVTPLAVNFKFDLEDYLTVLGQDKTLPDIARHPTKGIV